MSLKKIIYLQSEQDFQTLVSTGSLTKDGKTLTYQPDTTDYRVKYTEPNIPVKGVQVAGTDLVPDANGKVNVPIGSSTEKGVVQSSTTWGTFISSGTIGVQKATDAEIMAESSNYKPIVPSNLQVAVDTGVKGSTNYSSFTVEKSDGTTGTLKLYCELT